MPTAKNVLLSVLSISALALPTACASGARAASYTIETCAGEPATAGGWQLAAAGGMPGGQSDTCPSGGGFSAWIDGETGSVPPGRYGWIFKAPANTTIGGFALWRTAFAAGVDGLPQNPSYTYGAFVYHPGGGYYYASPDSCNGDAECAQLRANGEYTSWTATQPTGMIYVRAVCDTSTPSQTCPSTSYPHAAEFTVRRADVTLNVGTQPQFTASPSGPLFEHRLISAPTAFTVSASDAGGGLAHVALLVDGRVAADFPFSDPRGTCGTPYRVPVPCPLATTQTFLFDPAALADGTHHVSVGIIDVTGVSQTVSGPYKVTTSHRGYLNGNPAPNTAVLTLRLRRRVVGYGTAVRLSGCLTTTSGQPIADAIITILARTDWSGRMRTLGHARTAGRGVFSLTVPPGPSREIAVVYRAGQRDPIPAATARIHLAVRAGVRAVFASRYPRGVTVLFTGVIRGPGIPAAGKLIEFQALRGGSWVTFAVGRSGRDGRYAVPYAFAPGPLTWHWLRALVPVESGFPFAPGANSPLLVLVG
jgi:hypothetical protein